MTQHTNAPAAQAEPRPASPDNAQPATKSRRPQRMAREGVVKAMGFSRAKALVGLIFRPIETVWGRGYALRDIEQTAQAA